MKQIHNDRHPFLAENWVWFWSAPVCKVWWLGPPRSDGASSADTRKKLFAAETAGGPWLPTLDHPPSQYVPAYNRAHNPMLKRVFGKIFRQIKANPSFWQTFGLFKIKSITLLLSLSSSIYTNKCKYIREMNILRGSFLTSIRESATNCFLILICFDWHCAAFSCDSLDH